MYLKLLFVQRRAIKQLVTKYLDAAFGVFTNNEKIGGIEIKKVPVYQGGYNQNILYISTVATGISKSHNSSSREISQVITTITKDIAQYLSQHSDNLFSIKIVPPGEIHLQLFESTLAAWLESLIVSSQTEDFVVKEDRRQVGGGTRPFLLKEFVPDSQNFIFQSGGFGADGGHNYADHLSPSSFSIQYAHARCCSLIRHGYQEGLIQLVPTVTGMETTVQSIPWLNSDQKLYLQHSDESFLIYQLVKVVDDLAMTNGGSRNWEKAGKKLGQAFERFWGSCRIWGEVKINSLELAQARLGLVMATQLVLKSVLEDKLGIIAPREL
ncbi:MAG: DALR anticodon-binding domain-containing protein [Cuspidothrix sp.]